LENHSLKNFQKIGYLIDYIPQICYNAQIAKILEDRGDETYVFYRRLEIFKKGGGNAAKRTRRAMAFCRGIRIEGDENPSRAGYHHAKFNSCRCQTTQKNE